MAFNQWTPAEEEMARVFYKSPLTDEEYLAKVGRTRMAWQGRQRYLKHRESVLQGRKVVRYMRSPVKVVIYERTLSRPTAQMMSEAQRRELARLSRSQTQELMGDPAPGYSALDKRVSS